MKITKDTLRQLIKEELSIMKENGADDYLDDLIGAQIGLAYDDVVDKLAYMKNQPEYSAQVDKYMRAYRAGQRGAREGVDKDEGQWKIKPNTQSVRDFYLRGHNDVTRILQAPLTPAEDDRARFADRPYRDWDASFKPEYAEGPYADADRASERATAKELAADRVKARQAERGGAPYQALGDAAERGSLQALRRLRKAAKADPEAQAILDAVEKAKRNARRMSSPPPLSADLEADMLEEIIREEIEAALSERVDPVKLAKDRADKQCDKHGEGSAECKKFRKRHKDAERSARKK